MIKHANAKNRFFSHVEKVPFSTCWYWTSEATYQGYGRIRINGKKVMAHRTSYEMHNGEIPSGMLVLHDCDNPACVNPDHLRIGTQKENMRQTTARGRWPDRRGTNSCSAKLTDSEILEIREMENTGYGFYTRIAKLYGVSRHTISRVYNRKRWTHIC